MARKDYYAVLGVPRNATSKQLKEQFRRLARERHPDRFQGEEKAAAELAFQDITEALNILSDPARRRQHDEALDRPATATRHDPKAASRVYIQRGLKEYKKGSFLEAASNFNRAVEIDSHNVEAWYQLARTAIEERRWLPKAREAIDRALELDSSQAVYWSLAGRIYEKSGQRSEARDHLRRAVALGAQDRQTRETLERLDGKRPVAAPSEAPARNRFSRLFRKT